MRRADTEDFTVPAHGRFGRNSGYESTYHVFLREERAGCLRQGTEATGRDEGRRGIEKTQPYVQTNIMLAIRLEDAMAVCAAAADASRKAEGCTETKEDAGVAEPKSDL